MDGENLAFTQNKKTASTKSFGSACKEDEYIIENSLRENELLKELHQHTLKNVESGFMISDAVQIQHFQMILKLLNAKKSIEIGTFTGYNVLSTALTMPEDGIIFALDVSEEYMNHGKPYFERANVSHKIKPMIGKAADSLEQLIAEGNSGTVDFVYIDADKANYELYYEKSLVLLRTGGIVALDNMLRRGLVYDPSKVTSLPEIKQKLYLDEATILRNLTKKLHKDMRIDISFLKIGDGVIFCRKL